MTLLESVSLTECNSGTTQICPFEVVTTLFFIYSI